MAGGFPTGGIGTSFYDTTTIVEDVGDIIYQITPEETPFYNMIGDTRSIAVQHEWFQRGLTTRQHNAQPEGFTFTFTTAMTLPTRQFNILQIFNKDIRVSRTQQQISHYAIESVYGDQAEIRMTEFKTDIEHALIQGTLHTGTATDEHRRLGGIVQAIAVGASTYTISSALGSMSEANFNAVLQNCWNLGAKPKDLLVGGQAKRHVSTYTTSGTKFVKGEMTERVNVVDQYVSDFFVVNVHLCRDVPAAGVHAGYSGFGFLWVDKTNLAKAWLQRPVAERTPKVADSLDAVIYAELTLEYGHPNAHFFYDKVHATA